MACSIDQQALLDCQNKPKGGLRRFGLLYNYTEYRAMVDAGKITRAANGEITGIVNGVGVQAYRFDMPSGSSLVPTTPVRAVSGGFDGYDHTATFTIIATTQDIKNDVDKMLTNKVVLIAMKNNGKGEVYGDEQGLKVVENNYNPSDADLGGVIQIGLKTADDDPAETRMPPNIFDTDAATTLALIEGLVTPGV